MISRSTYSEPGRHPTPHWKRQPGVAVLLEAQAIDIQISSPLSAHRPAGRLPWGTAHSTYLQMDDKISTRHNALERMLIDENAEPTNLPLSLLEDITKCFSDDHQIGVGGFAVVYKGMVGNEAVAVKRLSTTFDMQENKFHKEVECLMKAKHKNIVRFLGYCSDTQGKIVDYEGKMVMADIRNWLLCFEYVPSGSLDKYITDASHGLGWKERYQIIKGICEGLCHLHEKRILHLDLKPANILIDDHMVPKIADFGLSRCLDKEQTRAITSNLCGSLGYLAPEFYSGHVSFASDIYSLGVIIVEILTGQKGYSEDDNVIDSWMIQLETSDQADTLLEQVKVCTKIGIECMDPNPKKRPAARHILDMIDKTESAAYSEETAISFPAKKRKKETAISSSSSHNPRVADAGVWDRVSGPACSDAEFQRAFHMSRATLHSLCHELVIAIAKDTTLCAAIPVHQHVGGDAAPAAMNGRRVWVRERSTEWWDRLSGLACPDAEFRQAFRMSRATFDAICDELGAAIAKEDTALRAAIPAQQRFAVCVWRLATGEPLREVSRRFGLGISTCYNIVLQVCAALTGVLMPKAIRLPLDSPEVTASRFEALSWIPGIVGAVCTDHIPIGPPKENVAEYYNRCLTERMNKASYSVALQAVVDADGTFTDVCIGLPGSLSDTAVFEQSALHARCEAGLFGDNQYWLVGGPRYPLKDWMLVPYAYQNLTWAPSTSVSRLRTELRGARYRGSRHGGASCSAAPSPSCQTFTT
uniref:Protein kinase domain-containing protein n=1 Tax=Aegilops tauschii subsp. strangulata TaxID=200361 RepID=A0A453AKX1_AEGTS